MADESTLFGQLSQLNPSGQTRNSKEVPVDKDSSRGPKRRKKERGKPAPEESGLEDPEEARTKSRPRAKWWTFWSRV